MNRTLITISCFTLCFCLLFGTAATALAELAEGGTKTYQTRSWGVGVGIPYGGVGIRGELGLVSGFSLTGGLGYSLWPSAVYQSSIMAATLGLVWYPPETTSTFRPRLGMFVGENQSRRVYIVEGETQVAETGLSLLTGVGVRLSRRSSFDIDLLYAFQNKKTRASGKHSSVWQIAIGYRWWWSKTVPGSGSTDKHPR